MCACIGNQSSDIIKKKSLNTTFYSIYVLNEKLQLKHSGDGPADSEETGHFTGTCTAQPVNATLDTALHSSARHCTASYFTGLHFTVLLCIWLLCNSLHWNALSLCALNHTALQFKTRSSDTHFPSTTATSQYILHCMLLQYTALHCTRRGWEGMYWLFGSWQSVYIE